MARKVSPALWAGVLVALFTAPLLARANDGDGEFPPMRERCDAKTFDEAKMMILRRNRLQNHLRLTERVLSAAQQEEPEHMDRCRRCFAESLIGNDGAESPEMLCQRCQTSSFECIYESSECKMDEADLQALRDRDRINLESTVKRAKIALENFLRNEWSSHISRVCQEELREDMAGATGGGSIAGRDTEDSYPNEDPYPYEEPVITKAQPYEEPVITKAQPYEVPVTARDRQSEGPVHRAREGPAKYEGVGSGQPEGYDRLHGPPHRPPRAEERMRREPNHYEFDDQSQPDAESGRGLDATYEELDDNDPRGDAESGRGLDATYEELDDNDPRGLERTFEGPRGMTDSQDSAGYEKVDLGNSGKSVDSAGYDLVGSANHLSGSTSSQDSAGYEKLPETLPQLPPSRLRANAFIGEGDRDESDLQ